MQCEVNVTVALLLANRDVPTSDPPVPVQAASHGRRSWPGAASYRRQAWFLSDQ